jgi:nucleotide-binding universal stress UspA family protein
MAGSPARGVPDPRAGTADALEEHVAIRRILVPVDFSPPSDAALRYAIELAHRLDARLDLLHVFQVPTFAFPDAVIPVPAQTVVELRTASEERLEVLQREATAAGLRTSVVIADGTPFVEIVRTARSQAADLVIMGTHGRSGLRHALLGSVAEKVVRKAPCPVLVVRGGDQRVELP